MDTKEFLYVFGYEAPTDRKVNHLFGTEQESSNLLKIIAETEFQAKQWGDEIAENFINYLYEKSGLSKVSWRDDGYATWIEKSPDEYTL